MKYGDNVFLLRARLRDSQVAGRRGPTYPLRVDTCKLLQAITNFRGNGLKTKLKKAVHFPSEPQDASDQLHFGHGSSTLSHDTQENFGGVNFNLSVFTDPERLIHVHSPY